MLAAAHRLRRSADFTTTVRAGSRAAEPTLLVYLHRAATADPDARVGFVVGKSVGPAVRRNQVRRRLRHLMRDRVGGLPPGSRLVIRAQSAAAAADHATLGRDLDAALRRLVSGRSR